MQTQSVVVAGTKPTFAAPSLTDVADVGTVLVVKNTNASSMTVTIDAPGTLPTGDAYPDKVYTVAATTGEAWIPVLDVYAQGTARQANLTFSSITGVTAAVIARF